MGGANVVGAKAWYDNTTVQYSGASEKAAGSEGGSPSDVVVGDSLTPKGIKRSVVASPGNPKPNIAPPGSSGSLSDKLSLNETVALVIAKDMAGRRLESLKDYDVNEFSVLGVGDKIRDNFSALKRELEHVAGIVATFPQSNEVRNKIAALRSKIDTLSAQYEKTSEPLENDFHDAHQELMEALDGSDEESNAIAKYDERVREIRENDSAAQDSINSVATEIMGVYFSYLPKNNLTFPQHHPEINNGVW